VVALEVALALVVVAAPHRVELVFGGDVIPHSPVKHVATLHAKWDSEQPKKSLNHLGWDHVFGPLAETFREADLAIINLETPVSGDPKAKTGGFLFDAPPSLLDGLVAAGVDVATFANNHALDQHRDGILATRAALETAGLLSAGADASEEQAWAPLVVEKNGIRVGFLAFTRFLNGFHNLPDSKKPHVPLVHYASDRESGGYDELQLLERVRAAAQNCDVLIVIPHWGDEYQPQPKVDDRRLAEKLVEAGALAVIGSHPHVLQPVQTLTRPDGSLALVAFSLGNLVSNQDLTQPESPTREGLLLKLVLEREAGAPVKLRRVEPLPVWTENVLKAGERRNLQPTVVDDELAAMRDRLRTLESRDDKVSQSELKSLTRRLKEAQSRRERILRVVPAELQRTPPTAPSAERVESFPTRIH
jgi:poly-gamma-glutamate capsule biosynthesis protein CapA/YwtB (metallophosphatase superfamily)